MKTFDSYRLLITPLSPVHIGIGESYEPTNYVIEDGVLHEFEPGASADAMESADRERLLSITSNKPGPEMIQAVQRFFFERRRALMARSVNQIPVLPGVARLYEERIGKAANIETGGRKVINRLEIDRTAFNPISHLPVVYGSSLKGAIRTALLDKINNAAPLRKIVDDRTEREREENSLQLQQRLFKFRTGRFEMDPMRLVQLCDAVWAGSSDLPATNVYLAVNRKKALVRDQDGRLRQSLAEKNNLYQILECASPWSYRSFSAQINLQSLDGINESQHNKIPAGDLHFSIVDIANACNRFYRLVLDNEVKLMRDRGYLDDTWDRSVQQLMKMSAERMHRGEVFLLRVGRHSGAESVTLNGARKIKINRGKGQQPKWSKEAKTLWLAASEIEQSSGLLPFGWLLIEVVPLTYNAANWLELKAVCDSHMTQARAFAKHIAERRAELGKALFEADAKKQAAAEAMRAQQRLEEEERRRKEAAEQSVRAAEEARLAALSPLDRSIEDVLRKDTDPGKKDFVKLLEALRKGTWAEAEDRRYVAQRIKSEMQQMNLWKEASTKKNPEKDHDYQRTLEVMRFLS